jgi:hypothetical protein
MIRASDVAFHTPSNVTYDWAETTYFSVYIPEGNITAWVYIVMRAGVGAAMADIEVINGIRRKPLDANYFDMQQHLPLPARLDDFTLPNGLSIKTSNQPRDYQIDYIGVDDTELHWTARGLMEPFDINDPAMDPRAAPGDIAHSGFGAAYANHFDMTAHITGTIKIRGKTHAVDCVTTMDHSWGPRNERQLKPMGWINANFNQQTAFSTIWSFDPLARGWEQFGFAHGYALINGKVRGLKSGRQRAVRQGPFPSGYEMIVTDINDDEHLLIGQTIAQIPWSCYSNSMAMATTVRWHYAGLTGVGLAQENWPLDRLTGHDFGA